MKKIGLFFGSFDPIHIGHINVATSVLNLHIVDEVHLVVAYSNPWKKKQTPFEDRVAMTNIAIENIPNLACNCVEKSVWGTKGTTYTFDVLEAIRSENKGNELYIITTQETYKEIPHWKNGKEILNNNKFIIISSKHFGNNDINLNDRCVMIEIKDIPICSTIVRNLIKNNKIALPFLDVNVDNYIKKYKLYLKMLITINTDEQKNQELALTAAGMVSSDYKERFKAEYVQIKNRYNGLVNMVKKWDEGTLTFTPTCPRETYNFQLRAMKDYMDILVVRAKIENIEL